MRIIALFFMLFSFILESQAGFFAPTCSASSCGSLQGFKKCLADPTSPYRYFIYHPETIGDSRAFQRLRKFTDVHPNCYAQFCNRVCSTVPEQFQDSEMVRGEKSNWLSRQTDRFRQNERWRSRELEKRGKVQNQIAKLCKRQDLIGNEIRLLCSECDAYLKKDRQLIPACRARVSYKPSRIKVRKREMQEFSRGEDNDWGMQAIQNADYGRARERFINTQGQRRRGEYSRRALQEEDSFSRRSRGARRGDVEERDDMSEVASQRSGRSDRSRRSAASRLSQDSERSASSRSSRTSQLTAENLAQLPRGKGQSVEGWRENVSDASSDSGVSEDAFSEDSSEEGSEESDDDSETSSVFSDDD
jgi:hypothetical protein